MINDGLRIMQQELQHKQWKHGGARGHAAAPVPAAARHASNFFPSSVPKVRCFLGWYGLVFRLFFSGGIPVNAPSLPYFAWCL